MKHILTILALSVCLAGMAGCSSGPDPGGSTPTGTMAPPSGSMTPAERQAAFFKSVPQQARQGTGKTGGN